MPKIPTYCQQPRIEEAVSVRFKLTDEELLELLQQIAGHDETLIEVENEKKEVMADIKARMEAAETARRLMSAKARLGYEDRMTETLVVLDPKKKQKHFYIEETGLLVKSAAMTPEDFQVQMQFEKPGTTAEEE